jgi:hypothetical protein
VTHCTFIPTFLLERIAASHPDREASRCCAATLVLDAELRNQRRDHPGRRPPQRPASTTEQSEWTVHDAAHGTTLPGALVRSAGDRESGDAAVDEAATGLTATLDFFTSVLSRRSYDDEGAEVVATVHYGRDYDNALWNGDQLVLGDGDGKVFGRFTRSLDVLGHEFGHAVTQHSAALAYEGQSGALNESVSDVFGSMVKQREGGETSAHADWLIGEGIFTAEVQGVALRSMKDPGTAYDDDVLGKDPQVGSMSDYVETADDNGGVHINSGIPNRAFYLVAMALGGSSWDEAGPIWYAALTGGAVETNTGFAGFAAATVAAARDRHGAGSRQERAVTDAWAAVGVTTGDSRAPTGGDPTGRPVLEVRRSGGFAGLTSSGFIDEGDPRKDEALALLGRIDFASATRTAPQPDRFSYVFVLGGQEVTVQEQDLTDDLRRLADLVLREERSEAR